MEKHCTRHDLKYARVPTGLETCAFCFTLASNGFCYTSENSAKHAHDNCDCIVVPGFKGLEQDGQIEGYKPKEMAKRWSSIKDAVDGGRDLFDEWQNMSKEERSKYKRFDDFKTKQYLAEARTRDPKWLYSGKIHSPTYETPSVERDITVDKPHQGRTGFRCSVFGIRPDFIKDSIENANGNRIGLPDLADGTEIKTLLSSGNAYGAIKNHFDNTVGKQGLRRLIIDNYESEQLTDSDVIGAINALFDEYDFPNAYLITKNMKLIKVK